MKWFLVYNFFIYSLILLIFETKLLQYIITKFRCPLRTFFVYLFESTPFGVVPNSYDTILLIFNTKLYKYKSNAMT